jgi:hypothetical protein
LVEFIKDAIEHFKFLELSHADAQVVRVVLEAAADKYIPRGHQLSKFSCIPSNVRADEIGLGWQRLDAIFWTS